MSFAHMKAYVNASGGNIRQAKIKDGQRIAKLQLETDPSYNDSVYLWEHDKPLEELENIPIKLFGERHSEAAGFTIKFNALYDKRPLVGDVLYDGKTGLYWLCWESYDRHGINSAGMMKRITVWIKWQDKDGNVLYYPAFDDNSTQYNTGTTGDNMVTLGSSNHMLFMPADKNTVLIDHDLRFFLDRNEENPTVFKVTQNDTTAMSYDKGIIKVTGSEDEYKPEVDRKDLWICDYRPPEPTYDFKIAYTGKPAVMVGGSKQFTASRDDAVFTAALPDKLKPYIQISDTGTIIAELYQRIIGESFVLNADCPDGSHAEVTVTVTGGV